MREIGEEAATIRGSNFLMLLDLNFAPLLRLEKTEEGSSLNIHSFSKTAVFWDTLRVGSSSSLMPRSVRVSTGFSSIS